MFAPQPQFQGCLQKAQQILRTESESPKFTQREANFRSIPVSRIRDNTVMGYRSAIARQLSSQWQKSPEAIASSLGAILAQQQSDWEIRVLPQGWLEGKLCHRSLAAWLQHSLEFIVPTVADTTETPLTAALFPLQYIHVRFCTLLQMAHRDRLIRLEYPDTPPPWRWQSPQNVPWLQNHRIRFSQTAEWALLGQIWDILDLEAIAPTKIGLQAALRLGKAGLQFEQTCRIWGEVQRNTPQLALTRLALVAMAQKVLWRLLREQLQVTPRWRL